VFAAVCPGAGAGDIDRLPHGQHLAAAMLKEGVWPAIVGTAALTADAGS